jgi:hypothetical protein
MAAWVTTWAAVALREVDIMILHVRSGVLLEIVIVGSSACSAHIGQSRLRLDWIIVVTSR